MLIGIFLFCIQFFLYELYIRLWRDILSKQSNHENYLKIENGYDAETLEAIVSNVTGKDKIGYCDRTDVIKTRPIPKFLYQEKLV